MFQVDYSIIWYIYCVSFPLSVSIHTYNYTRLTGLSIGYALTTKDTKSGFYLYVHFFLFTPHGNFNVQTHTHTQNKNSAKKKQNKKQTNKHPPPKKNNKTKTNKQKTKKKHFRVLFESVTGCKDSIPIFLFE